MQELIYDVAVSADGFIAGPDEDVSRFPDKGPIVADYLERLQSYAACVMGRRTYTFGYRFGLKPGQNPYAHMRTLVFSKSADLPPDSEVEVLRTWNKQVIDNLKAAADGPIYLCGGGSFAGSLLGLGLIDRIRLKRAPVVLGSGVRLFGEVVAARYLRHVETRQYEDGYMYQEYQLIEC